MSFLRRKGKDEKGQAMVEFALLLPLMLLILCAVIDFGWLFMHELVLNTAVRDGARVGITCAEASDFRTTVQQRVEDGASICNNSTLHVDPVYSGGNVVVTATYNLNMLTPMAPIIVGGMTYTIDTSCTMKAE